VLTAARQTQNLSFNQLAKLSGVTRQMISYVESRQRVPTVDTLVRLATALGLNASDLLANAEEGEKPGKRQARTDPSPR